MNKVKTTTYEILVSGFEVMDDESHQSNPRSI